jgi:hypothetical protein
MDFIFNSEVLGFQIEKGDFHVCLQKKIGSKIQDQGSRFKVKSPCVPLYESGKSLDSRLCGNDRGGRE